VRYVRATIANQGGTIANNVKVNIFRDSSLFKTLIIESIPAGSTYDILESYTLPVSGLAGSQIKVVLDPDKTIEESNEYNNEGSLSVTGNQPKRSVKIKCSLANFTGLPNSVSVNIDWSADGSDRSSFSAAPDGTGLVSFEIDPSKSGVLHVKPNHWLSESFTIGSGSDTINLGTVGFTNGDADGDNYINLFDFVILDRKFGSSDVMGDLDGSGSVNLFDYVIIDQNFGRQGE
jgi:subtilase family serine protease